MHLHTLWYVIIAVFWTGFFVLEGFDFGVGVLHAIVARNDTERRIARATIGPWWDGNEVWLIVAGAGTFAAFPGWYATMFSALYLALLLVLAGLMARGTALEWGEKVATPRWRTTWRWALTIGSAAVPLLIGVGLGDLLAGLPINSSHNFTGDFFDLLTPYGLWTGVTLLTLSLLHGATFLSLRTTGIVHDRARAAARAASWAAVAAVLGFVIWTRAVAGGTFGLPVPALAVIAALGAAWLVYAKQDGWSFAASAVTIAAVVVCLFAALYPNVMISSTQAAFDLTVSNSASGGYALKVMTVVAVLFFPLVLLYQGWSFYVFRGRIDGPSEPAVADAPSGPPSAPAGPAPAAP
jgi:cytochrome d ubiquinol oxidase subunit II